MKGERRVRVVDGERRRRQVASLRGIAFPLIIPFDKPSPRTHKHASSVLYLRDLDLARAFVILPRFRLWTADTPRHSFVHEPWVTVTVISLLLTLCCCFVDVVILGLYSQPGRRFLPESLSSLLEWRLEHEFAGMQQQWQVCRMKTLACAI
jgi:hypothetical protein